MTSRRAPISVRRDLGSSGASGGIGGRLSIPQPTRVRRGRLCCFAHLTHSPLASGSRSRHAGRVRSGTASGPATIHPEEQNRHDAICPASPSPTPECMPVTLHAGLGRIAVLGNHLPRQCGIATFTTHLVDAVAAAAPGCEILVVAVNDPGKVHAYPPRVRFEIAETDPASYVRCADFLNGNGAELVCLQHEFGIFG